MDDLPNPLPPNPAPPAADEPPRPGSWRRWTWVALLALGVLGGGSRLREILTDLPRRIEELGPAGPILFVAVYVTAAVILVPGSALTLAAGAMFGFVRGFAWVSLASTLGATAAFLVGRHLARDWVARRLRDHPRFAAIDQAVAEQGWRIVLLTRLSPVFPFTLLNYAYGLTRVRLADYVAASWIGMMPGTALYVYLGTLARAGVEGTRGASVPWALRLLGLAATVAVVVLIARTARRILSRHLEPPTNPPR